MCLPAIYPTHAWFPQVSSRTSSRATSTGPPSNVPSAMPSCVRCCCNLRMGLERDGGWWMTSGWMVDDMRDIGALQGGCWWGEVLLWGFSCGFCSACRNRTAGLVLPEKKGDLGPPWPEMRFGSLGFVWKGQLAPRPGFSFAMTMVSNAWPNLRPTHPPQRKLGTILGEVWISFSTHFFVSTT